MPCPGKRGRQRKRVRTKQKNSPPSKKSAIINNENSNDAKRVLNMDLELKQEIDDGTLSRGDGSSHSVGESNHRFSMIGPTI